MTGTLIVPEQNGFIGTTIQHVVSKVHTEQNACCFPIMMDCTLGMALMNLAPDMRYAGSDQDRCVCVVLPIVRHSSMGVPR